MATVYKNQKDKNAFFKSNTILISTEQYIISNMHTQQNSLKRLQNIPTSNSTV